MTGPGAQHVAAPAGPLAWCAANKHFLVAAVILAVTAAGWSVAINALKWVTHKEPVPWPARVTVDAATFRNTSLSTRFGPESMPDMFFRSEDGQLFRNPDGTKKLDGKPDGEIIITEKDVMESLGIGSALDEARLDDRQSNWYVSRLYTDKRSMTPRGPRKVLQLSVYYYTGRLDLVPHVGEACLAAAGATIVETSVAEFTIPDAPEPWRGPIGFKRTVYEKDAWRYVQYHIFSMNGTPENDRLTVRRQLMYPWVSHNFFAKIEIALRWRVTDVAEADSAAEEFLRYCMPEVLRELATREDVSRLSEAQTK